jgi:hypothetical protein
MPNEPVQCPNCGSGDVRQLVSDLYRCEHCQTEFRWVDPTKTTVVQKPSACACGNVAQAFCVRCGEPLCKIHKKDWWLAVTSSMSLIMELYPSDTEPPEWVRRAMEKSRVPKQPNAILCAKCESECDAVLAATLEAVEKTFSDPDGQRIRNLEAALRAKEESPLPTAPPTRKTSRGSSLLGRLWDWLRGLGK